MTAKKWSRDKFKNLDTLDIEAIESLVQSMLQIARPMDNMNPAQTTKIRRTVARLALERFLGRKRPGEKKDVSE